MLLQNNTTALPAARHIQREHKTHILKQTHPKTSQVEPGMAQDVPFNVKSESSRAAVQRDITAPPHPPPREG